MDLDKCLFHGDAFIPSLSVVGNFILKGQLLVFPINGNGHNNNTLCKYSSSDARNLKKPNVLFFFFLFSDEIVAELDMKCEKFDKDGKDYVRIKEFNVKLDPKEVNFFYDNLGVDETIGKEVQKVLNENSKLIFTDIKGDYEVSYGQIFKEMSNKIFTKIPINEIFLD